jgi:hypothetical protein
MKKILFLFFIQVIFLPLSLARQAGEGSSGMNRSQDVFDGRGETKYNVEAHEQDRLRDRQKIQKQEADLKRERLKKKIHQKNP